ncbi:MAG: ABC transporter ATP-binding protein [Candidatus Aenigmatarchaeota archaeon]|nr:MAG: ABC transporter ATP-binding protein [Candidatus Aenigmarchaeota archaeon]
MVLEIKDLKVKSGEKEILKGMNLKINSGETHALLGPNASGKSTLVQVLAGNPRYEIAGGSILFNGLDITKLPTEERINLGLAIAWQNPPTIKGVKLSKLLDKISKKKIEPEELGANPGVLDRSVNLNFSGGEKKISELLQVISLNPKLVIFDEIDSGLDINKLEKVSKIIKKELIDKNVSVLVITHSGEILNFLKPEIINVLVDGKIICEENNYKRVLKTIKKYGYEKCRECELHADGP